MECSLGNAPSMLLPPTQGDETSAKIICVSGFTMIYVNPDDLLGNPRIFTDERNREAWRACKDLVERTLAEATEPYNFYLVCGVQGSGKTRWVMDNIASFAEPAIVFDAAFSRARDRAGAVAQARCFSCRLICIWVSCPLDVALAQNHARPLDQVVPDEVVRLVFNTFEPPTLEEGFDGVFKVEPGLPGPTSPRIAI